MSSAYWGKNIFAQRLQNLLPLAPGECAPQIVNQRIDRRG